MKRRMHKVNALVIVLGFTTPAGEPTAVPPLVPPIAAAFEPRARMPMALLRSTLYCRAPLLALRKHDEDSVAAIQHDRAHGLDDRNAVADDRAQRLAWIITLPSAKICCDSDRKE